MLKIVCFLDECNPSPPGIIVIGPTRFAHHPVAAVNFSYHADRCIETIGQVTNVGPSIIRRVIERNVFRSNLSVSGSGNDEKAASVGPGRRSCMRARDSHVRSSRPRVL